jgi:hypothetical protein
MFCLPPKSISFVRYSTSHPSRHKAARIAACVFFYLDPETCGKSSRTVFRGPLMHARIDVLRGSNAGEPSQTLADHGTSRQKCDVIKKLAIDMCRGQRRSYRVQIIARRYINVTLR